MGEGYKLNRSSVHYKINTQKHKSEEQKEHKVSWHRQQAAKTDEGGGGREKPRLDKLRLETISTLILVGRKTGTLK